MARNVLVLSRDDHRDQGALTTITVSEDAVLVTAKPERDSREHELDVEVRSQRSGERWRNPPPPMRRAVELMIASLSVRKAGVEPARPRALVPKTSVSAVPPLPRVR